MIDFIAHNIAPIMFVTLVLVMLIGYPVAFSLAAVGLGFFALGVFLTPLSHGAIHLDWAQIVSVKTDAPLKLKLTTGETLEGKVVPGAEGRLKVETAGAAAPERRAPSPVRRPTA